MPGAVQVEDTGVGRDRLLYLGRERGSLTVRAANGARLVILGGEPLTEETLAYRQARARGESRCPPAVDRGERVMEAPPMPSVALEPRPRRGSAR